jgi:hypothetical protein
MNASLTWDDVQRMISKLQDAGAILPPGEWWVPIHPDAYAAWQEAERRYQKRRNAYLRRYRRQGERMRKQGKSK